MTNRLLARVAVLACTAVVLLCATQLPAEYAPPKDLSPGSQYQLIFFTNGERDALSPYIDDYNNFVTAEANLHPELPDATWRAIVSTQGDGGGIPTVHARFNAMNYAGIPVYNTRGERVSDGEWGTWGYGERSDLYNAGLDNHHAQIYDPHGNPQGMQYVATGSWFTGSIKYGAGRPPWSEGWPFYDCYITVGLPGRVDDGWIDAGQDFGNFSLWNFEFYGLSSVITAVPEPSTLVLLGVGAIGLLAYAWRRRCRVPSLFRISLIVAVGLSLAVTSPAAAEYGSKIERFNVGGHPYYTNLGGAGSGYIYCAGSWSDGQGSPYGDHYSTTASGAAFASAQSGSLGIGFTGSLDNVWAGTYGWVGLMMGADAGTQFWDHFTIGPGDSGLSYGTPVQFAFHVSLTGSVSFNGNDSGVAIKSSAGWLYYDAQLQGTHLNNPTPEARYMYAEVRYPASP